MACKFHKIKFYHPEPSPINCVSYNSSRRWLALSRKNASIEIWDLQHMPCLLKVIPGVENGSIEALGWVNDRLLSTGLSGALVEWDVLKLVTKNTVLLTGSAGWCLDVNASLTVVAVGTEQGYVNMFSVEDDSILYERLFDKQEGRILCCKFDKTGNYLVTGSVNTIRVWDVQTGQAINRMSTSRRRKEVIVWCLAVLSDLTIISGDSTGRLIFWNGHMGEQIESYSTHEADILSICITDDEMSLYCAGVDPLIVNYAKVPVYKLGLPEEKLEWVKSVQRNIHEHDVRGLVHKNGQLISVGADGFISLSSYPPKRLMQIPPFVPLTKSIVCPEKNLLLLRYKNYIEIWRLGKYATSDNGEPKYSNNSNSFLDIQAAENPESYGFSNDSHDITSHKRLKLSATPVKLLSLKTKNGCELTCCAISHDGQWIAYSTELDFRIFNFCLDDNDTPSITKVVPIQTECVPCHHMTFSFDNMLVTGSPNGNIRIINVDISGGAHVLQTLNLESGLKDTSLLHLDSVSVESKTETTSFIIASNCSGGIVVWRKNEGKKYDFYLTLPNYCCPVSAFSVNQLGILVVVYTDHKEEKHSYQQKRGKRQRGTLSVNMKMLDIQYVGGMSWLSQDEAVILEISPQSILKQLPPVFPTKRRYK